MKGIILAGGSATRLRPLTTSNSKHLLPVYDKPMVYYPLSTLMLAGIRDILLITNPEHIEAYKKLLGDGNDFGININYKIQDRPSGIPEAFIIGEKFIDNDKCCLILGDNLFFGRELESLLNNTLSDIHGAKVFCYQVKDPERYGVLEVNKDGKAISIKEKPKKPLSDYAITGLYFYDENVVSIAKELKPSSRNELEITDVNNFYLANNLLSFDVLGRGMTWFDTGTFDSLLDASNFVSIVQRRQGLLMSCPEEISWRKGWIDAETLMRSTAKYKNDFYNKYFQMLLND